MTTARSLCLSVALAAAMVREARRERRREPVRVLFYSERDR